MAADAYIEMAASQIRDAINHLQGEIHSIQAEAYDREQRLKGEISRLESEYTVDHMTLQEHESMHDTQNTQPLRQRVQQLTATISQKKGEVTNTSQGAATEVQKRTGLLKRLQQLVPQIESLVPSARF